MQFIENIKQAITNWKIRRGRKALGLCPIHGIPLQPQGWYDDMICGECYAENHPLYKVEGLNIVADLTDELKIPFTLDDMRKLVKANEKKRITSHNDYILMTRDQIDFFKSLTSMQVRPGSPTIVEHYFAGYQIREKKS